MSKHLMNFLNRPDTDQRILGEVFRPALDPPGLKGWITGVIEARESGRLQSWEDLTELGISAPVMEELGDCLHEYAVTHLPDRGQGGGGEPYAAPPQNGGGTHVTPLEPWNGPGEGLEHCPPHGGDLVSTPMPFGPGGIEVPEDGRELISTLTDCTLVKSVTITPPRQTFAAPAFASIDDLSDRLGSIYLSAVTGLELLVSKTEILGRGVPSMGMDQKRLQKQLGDALGRTPNLNQKAGPNDFKSGDDGKLDRSTVPGLDELDKAVTALDALMGPAIQQAAKSMFARTGQVQIQFTDPKPADIGRDVTIRLEEGLTHRLNTPTTKNPRVAIFTIGGETLTTNLPDADDAFFSDNPVRSSLATTEITVKLPASGVLTGTYVLLGNYGKARLSASYTCLVGQGAMVLAPGRELSGTSSAVLTVDGVVEEELRALEAARSGKVLSQISAISDQYATIKNLIGVINALIDAISTSIPIPFLGDAVELVANFIENGLQAGAEALDGSLRGVLDSIRAQNEVVNGINLAIADSFPEAGRPGAKEVLGIADPPPPGAGKSF